MTSATAQAGRPVGLGDPAPDVQLATTGGAAELLAPKWAEQPLVLALLGKLDHEAIVDRALTLRDAEPEIDQAGGCLLIVAQVTPLELGEFADKHSLRVLTFADPLGDAHTAFGVASDAPACFVIDTQGIVRYAHRSRSAVDAASTWELLDAVCGLTGEVVERPEPANIARPVFSAIHAGSKGGVLLPAVQANTAAYSCPKCAHGSYEIVKIATSGGWLSRLFNFQYRQFAAVVCTSCNFAELYRTKGGSVANIADILAGA